MVTLFYQQGSTDIDGLLINIDNYIASNDNSDIDNSYKALFGEGLKNMAVTAKAG